MDVGEFVNFLNLANNAWTDQQHKQTDFWLTKLGASRLLPAAFSACVIRKFRFRLTGAAELQAAQNWSDLSERYSSFVNMGGTAL